MAKKEIQDVIIKKIIQNASEEEFLNIIKIVAPGTQIRTAIDGILKGGKGALIVVQNERLFPLMDGGFRINMRFTPQRMIELAKMDGAIILSHNLKRIEYANVLLTPSSSVKSEETGTRHKAAERTAKQIGTLVIAISERRNETTLFYKNKRYVLKNTEEIFSQVSRHLGIIERYRGLFDMFLSELDKFEIALFPNIDLAIQIIQKGKMLQKMEEEIRQPLVELGKEGDFLRLHLKELVLGIERQTNLIIKDYASTKFGKSKKMLNDLTYEKLLEKEKILEALFYEGSAKKIEIKGWRLLSKMQISEKEAAKIFKEGINIRDILYNPPKNLKDILGEEKYKVFAENLKKMLGDNSNLKNYDFT